jgi:hypothetical protein
MKKFLMVLMMVFSIAVTFTACNSTFEEPGKTIAVYNASDVTLAIVPLDENMNELTERAVMLPVHKLVRMKFPLESVRTMIIVDPGVFKVSGKYIITGGRWYRTGIQENGYYRYLYYNNKMSMTKGVLTEEQMVEIPEGTLVIDTYVED